jgi:hypothetical protein
MSARASPSLRALYRLQLATALHFDAHPGMKALLSLLGGGEAAATAVPAQLRRFLGDAEGGGAPAPYAPPRSLAAFVRSAYREAPPAGGAAAAEAAGVACQRELVRLADLCTVWAAAGGGGGGGGSGRAAAEALPGVLAEADTVRPGALLLEHPAVLHPGRGVLLITDIARRVRGDDGGGDGGSDSGEEDRWELRALTLNRPLPQTVGGAFPRLAGSLGSLAALPLFFGGPAGGDALYVLHRFPGVPGAVPVDGPPPEAGSAEAAAAAAPGGARCGLFLGGDAEALAQRVARGGAADVRVCVGHVEVPLRAGEGGALALPGAERLLVAAGTGAAAQALCAPLAPPPRGGGARASGPAGGYDVARYWHQNAAWERALAQLGAHAELEHAERGRELAAFAAEEAHAAVAHYAAAGWSAKDLEQVLR